MRHSVLFAAAQYLKFAFCWDESTAGRSASEIASTFAQFILRNRDIKTFIIWTDNCASQNKNWLLFSTLLRLVNRRDLAVESIELKYLETGHTFMSADSDHGYAGRQLGKHECVYDLDDFRKIVSSERIEGVTMKTEDFFPA